MAPQVAEQLRHSAGSTAEQRTRMLQASLEEQLGEARRAAEESAASRAAAEAAAAAAQQQLEAVQQQRAELARAEKQQKSAGGEVQQRAQKLLADARAGRQTVQQVEEALRAMQREAAAPEGAAMRLMGLQAAKVGLGGSDGCQRCCQGGREHHLKSLKCLSLCMAGLRPPCTAAGQRRRPGQRHGRLGGGSSCQHCGAAGLGAGGGRDGARAQDGRRSRHRCVAA